MEIKKFGNGNAIGFGIIISWDNFKGISIVFGHTQLNIGKGLI